MTIAVAPASYTLHSGSASQSGCGDYTSDDQASWNGGFDGLSQDGVTRVSDNVYKITGWTAGAGGSGVFATKTITEGDLTITLQIVPRFG